MAYTVALAGKGGTGKTTMAGFLIKFFISKGKAPVLAVDADANANLNDILGLEVYKTLGDARDDMKRNVSQGMTKDVFMDMRLQEAVIETKDFDLIVMGQPEGAGCYCAANTLLTQYLDKLIDNYKYVVIDNEAGMEHLSRLTTNNVDVLLIISDSTRRGIKAAARIVDLTNKLNLNISKKLLIVNRVEEDQKDLLEKVAMDFQLELIGLVPKDKELEEYDLRGQATINLENDNKAIQTAFEIFEKIF